MDFFFFLLTNAGFRLACRLPLCRVIIACCFRVAALSGNAPLALSPSGIAPELNRIQPVCNLPRWAKRQGYRSIGLTLLAAWSSLCGKWRLRSWTNIIIKAASGKLVWKQHKQAWKKKKQNGKLLAGNFVIWEGNHPTHALEGNLPCWREILPSLQGKHQKFQNNDPTNNTQFYTCIITSLS